MPRLISRHEALARIRQEGGDYVCLMCALLDERFGKNLDVFADERLVVILPRFVRRWGHVLVMLREHVTSFEALSVDDWLAMNQVAHRAARACERVLSPRRCYVASTGSSGGELTQTSAHMHIHVIPIYEPDDRPASVFSWSEGLLVADDDEWQSLLSSFRLAWDAVG